MRSSITKNGLTLRVIAGAHNAIIGIDLQESLRKNCLGFSIHRTDLGVADPNDKSITEVIKPAHWLPSMLQFPGAAAPVPPATFATMETAPLQKFRWGDYTLFPAHRYRFRVVARYGSPNALTPISDQDGVTVDVSTENPNSPDSAVFFNRAAAASEAFNRKFKDVKDVSDATAEAAEARKWLSNGLEEALLAFLGKATDGTFALHAAVYEFQKPNLLAALKSAATRGASVHVVYHARQKGANAAKADKTKTKNEAAIAAAGLNGVTNLVLTSRKADPQGAIMHNKFVVLLKKDAATNVFVPEAVWTGSTNWTDGGLYGQLNVGHAVYDPVVAAQYEHYFEELATDPTAHDLKNRLESLTPVSLFPPPAGQSIIPIFSPQSHETMLQLYATICEHAKCLLVSAPFALSPIIMKVLAQKQPGTLRFMLLDKISSLGKGEEVRVFEGDPSNFIAVATTLDSPLHNFQGKLLEDTQGFHHAGIHIHSKIILADPFGSAPILVTGSANFSNNSTEVNDSNSLIVYGHTAVADIYACDFMRMFEHYHFRAAQKAHPQSTLDLAADDSWSVLYYISGSQKEQDRRMFAGTL